MKRQRRELSRLFIIAIDVVIKECNENSKKIRGTKTYRQWLQKRKGAKRNLEMLKQTNVTSG